jgi:hypothetical protein
MQRLLVVAFCRVLDALAGLFDLLADRAISSYNNLHLLFGGQAHNPQRLICRLSTGVHCEQ